MPGDMAEISEGPEQWLGLRVRIESWVDDPEWADPERSPFVEVSLTLPITPISEDEAPMAVMCEQLENVCSVSCLTKIEASYPGDLLHNARLIAQAAAH